MTCIITKLGSSGTLSRVLAEKCFLSRRAPFSEVHPTQSQRSTSHTGHGMFLDNRTLARGLMFFVLLAPLFLLNAIVTFCCLTRSAVSTASTWWGTMLWIRRAHGPHVLAEQERQGSLKKVLSTKRRHAWHAHKSELGGVPLSSSLPLPDEAAEKVTAATVVAAEEEEEEQANALKSLSTEGMAEAA